jgi:hypothetical protein
MIVSSRSSHARVLIAGLLGTGYRPGQMGYDMCRLRLNRLSSHIPRTNRHPLTDDG